MDDSIRKLILLLPPVVKFHFVSVFPRQKFDCLVIRAGLSPGTAKKVQSSIEAAQAHRFITLKFQFSNKAQGGRRWLLICKKAYSEVLVRIMHTSGFRQSNASLIHRENEESSFCRSNGIINDCYDNFSELTLKLCHEIEHHPLKTCPPQ